MASTFTAVTEDDSVATKEEVVVNEVASVEQTAAHTLNQIDDEISTIDMELARLNTEKTRLEALRVDVDTEADKVALASKM
jgi:hypothetical protein